MHQLAARTMRQMVHQFKSSILPCKMEWNMGMIFENECVLLSYKKMVVEPELGFFKSK